MPSGRGSPLSSCFILLISTLIIMSSLHPGMDIFFRDSQEGSTIFASPSPLVISGNYLLNRVLDIGAGQAVIFDNATVLINSTYDGEYGIIVRSGGSLRIYDSAVKRVDPRGGYYFAAEAGSILEINGSLIEGCGYSGFEENRKGVYVATDYARIENSSFVNSTYGIYTDNCAPAILNSTFENNGIGIYSIRGKGTIHGCRFLGNDAGYQALLSTDEIENSVFTGNRYGVKLQSSKGWINSSSIDSGLFGIHFSSASPFLKNISIRDSRYGICSFNSFADLVDIRTNTTNYAIYSYLGQMNVKGMNTASVIYDIYSISSTVLVDNSTLTGSAVEANQGHIGMFNTSLPPDERITARRLSSISFINTSGNTATTHDNTSLDADATSVIRYGGYAEFYIQDSGGAPLDNATLISMADNFGVFSASSDAAGHISHIPFVNLTVNGTGEYWTNSTFIGVWSNGTGNLSGILEMPASDGTVLTMALTEENVSGVRVLRDYTAGTENLENTTVMVIGGFYTTATSNVSIRNSTLLIGKSISLNGVVSVENTSIISWAHDLACSPVQSSLQISASSTSRFSGTDLRGVPIKIYSDDCILANLTSEYSSTAAYIYFSSPVLKNIKISSSLTGIYKRSSSASISELIIEDCETGIYESFAKGTTRNALITRVSRGIYSTSSTSSSVNITIMGAGTGIYLQSSNTVIEKADIQAGTGVYASSSSPSLSNSSINATIAVKAISHSFPAAINTSLNLSSASMDRTSFLSIGNFSTLRVINSTNSPVSSISVVVFDRYGPCQLGKTDGNGIALISFRSGVLTSSGYEAFNSEVMAYSQNGTKGYLARMPFKPSMTLVLEENSSLVYYPTSYYVPPEGLVLENMTIIMEDNITVPNERSLTMISCDVFAGNSQFRIFGSWKTKDTRIRALTTDAPGIPHRYFPYFMNSQMSWLNDTSFDNPTEVSVYTQNVGMNNVTLRFSDARGLYIYGSNVAMKKLSVEWGGTGIYIDKGWPDLSDVVISNSTTGIYTTASRGKILGVVMKNDETGMSLYSSEMEITGRFLDTGTGISVYGGRANIDADFLNISMAVRAGSSVVVVSDSRIENCSSGIYSSSSHIDILNSDISGTTDRGIILSTSEGLISGNTLYDNAIGLYISASEPSLKNNLFVSNENGIYASNSYFTTQNCTFEANGIGIKSQWSALNVTGSVFKENTQGILITGNYEGPLLGAEGKYVTFMEPGEEEIYLSLPAGSTVNDVRLDFSGRLLWDMPVVNDNFIQRDASISENYAVWADYRNGNYDIYMRNISSDADNNSVPDIFQLPSINNDTQISSARNSQGFPVVSGDVIVWKEFLDNGAGQIVAYSIKNGTVWPISPVGNVAEPAIYGNIIAWSQISGGNREIFAYSISNGTRWQVSRNADDDQRPAIWEDRIVWYSANITLFSQRSNILLYNISTSTTYNITSDSYLEFNPAIWGNRIAWHDNSRGDIDGDGQDDQMVKIIDIGADGIPGTSDDSKAGESQGWESSFNPSLSENWAVWYYHNRTTDDWGATAMDLNTGEQINICSGNGGDAQPRLSGSKVIWMDKRDADWDIRIMDLEHNGMPSNVSIFLMNGGYGEKNSTGNLTTISFGYPLADAITAAGAIRGNITSESSGIVGCNIDMSITVEHGISRSTFILSPGNTSAGLVANDADIFMENCTFDSPPGTAALLNLTDSAVGLLNCTLGTYNEGLYLYGDSMLTIRNYLDILVLNGTSVPVEGAAVTVTDSGLPVYNSTTGAGGLIRWLKITDRVLHTGVCQENITIVSISHPDIYFPNLPREINMSRSHTEIFCADDDPPHVGIADIDSIYPASGRLNLTWSITDAELRENSTSIYLEYMTNRTASLLRDGLPESGSLMVNLSGLSGYLRMLVRGEDMAGHTGENHTGWFFVDDSAPLITLISPQNYSFITNNSMIRFNITDSSNITVYIRVNSGKWTLLGEVKSSDNHTIKREVEFGISTTDWAEGLNTLEINAIDETGQNSTSSWSFINDNGLPVIRIEHVEVIHSGRTINYTIEEDSLYSVSVQIDSSYSEIVALNGSAGYAGSIDTTGWSEGMHIIEITAEDSAGNRAAASKAVYIDDTPPVFHVDRSVVVEGGQAYLTITDIHLLSVRTTGAYSVNITNPEIDENGSLVLIISTNGWSDGAYSIIGTAEDQAGNTAIFLFNLIVDTQPPEIRTDAPSTVSPGQEIRLNISVEDENGIDSLVITYIINGTEEMIVLEPGNLTADIIIPAPEEEGMFEITAKAEDNAGNTAESVLSIMIIAPDQGNDTAPAGDNETAPPSIPEIYAPEPGLFMMFLIIASIILGILALIKRNRRKKRNHRER